MRQAVEMVEIWREPKALAPALADLNRLRRRV
jgi:hypothetical protein